MHARLAHRVIRAAEIQAFDYPLIEFRGGLVLGRGDELLRQRRYGRPADSFRSGEDYADRLNGTFSYGGPLHKGFGHVMSEMVHRIVPSRLMHGEAPFVFVAVAGRRGLAHGDLPAFLRDLLDLLGIGLESVRLVGRNTCVEEMFVAEQGSELGVGPKPGYLDDLAEYVTPRLDARHRGEDRPGKLYVSRSAMHGGLFLGERYLERQLAAEGFSIVYPERLPVSVQMDHYRKARVVVFAEGSACHGVELLGAGSLGRTYLLVRREGLVSNFERVLRPRAIDFAASSGHMLLGTKFLRARSAEPSTRTGVLVFDVKNLLAFFRAHGIAKLQGFSESDYFRAAEADLMEYLKPRPVSLVRKLLGAIRGKPRRSGLIHAANDDLIEAFSRHIGSRQ